MTLSRRLAAFALSLATSTALVAPAAAREATLAELLAEASDSIRAVNEATLAVAEAEAAYARQQAEVAAAARALAALFSAPPAPEVHTPPAPRPGSRLAALLDRRPAPADERVTDPHGTSIYDRLTFRR